MGGSPQVWAARGVVMACALVGLVGVAIDSSRVMGLGVLALLLATVLLALEMLRRQQELLQRAGAAAEQSRLIAKKLEKLRFWLWADNRGAERVRDIEALLQLFERFNPRTIMPPTGRYALDASVIARLVDLVERKNVRTIIDLGSGTSTVWLAYALERAGHGTVYSFDHDPEFVELTRRSLEPHGFEPGIVDLRLAPLVDVDLDGHSGSWYDVGAFDDVKDVELLIVDGPPKVNEQARFPALPVLSDRLASGAIVVVDDTHRPGETRIVERWLEMYPELRPLTGGRVGRATMLVWDEQQAQPTV